MKNNLYDLKYKATKNNTLILLEEYKYKGITVPEGFETNGADIPQVFWSFGYPPFEPKFLPAVVVHDYLIKKREIDFANYFYEEIMLEIEDNRKTKKMIKAVKMYWKYRKIKSKIKEKLWH